MLKAIQEKLKAIREFVLWWDRLEKAQGARTDLEPRDSAVTKFIAGRNGMPERKVIERWRKRTKDEKVFLQVLEDAEYRCARICELEKAGTVRGTEGTGEYERYTPAQYIEAARLVLGAIDLDPASSEAAQQIVQADDFFTEDEDGLIQEWIGRVWLNPPYHRDFVSKFINKLVAEYTAGRTTAAVLLTHNCTDTEWFDAAIRAAAGVCGRICFLDGRASPPKQMDTPPQGQAFFYFGDDVQRFATVFQSIVIVVPWRLRDVGAR